MMNVAYEKGQEIGAEQRDAEWLAAVDELSGSYMLSDKEREHETCIVHAFIHELKTRMEATGDKKPKCKTCKDVGHVNYKSCPDCGGK